MILEAEALGFFTNGLLLVTTLTLLASDDWRWILIALSLQYVGVFALTAQSWPLEQAVVKLVAGWMSAAILGSTRFSVSAPVEEDAHAAGSAFRLLAGGLVTLVVFSTVSDVRTFVPGASLSQTWGTVLLAGMGLLVMALSGQPLRVVLGLLVALSGFEIVYAVLEGSVLVTGLLAVTNLVLATIGAYLYLAPTLDLPERLR